MSEYVEIIQQLISERSRLRAALEAIAMIDDPTDYGWAFQDIARKALK